MLSGLCSFLEALRENLFPCFCRLWEAALIPWLMALSSIIRGSNLSSLWPLFCLHIFHSDQNQERFSKLKDSCDHTGPTWIIQDNLLILKSIPLITSAKPLLPHRVKNPRFLGIRVCTSLGAIILPP